MTNCKENPPLLCLLIHTVLFKGCVDTLHGQNAVVPVLCSPINKRDVQFMVRWNGGIVIL